MSESTPNTLENCRFPRLIIRIRPDLARMSAAMQKPAYRYTATGRLPDPPRSFQPVVVNIRHRLCPTLHPLACLYHPVCSHPAHESEHLPWKL